MTKYISEKMQMRHYEIIQSNKILEVVFVFSLSQQQQEQQQEQQKRQQKEQQQEQQHEQQQPWCFPKGLLGLMGCDTIEINLVFFGMSGQRFSRSVFGLSTGNDICGH